MPKYLDCEVCGRYREEGKDCIHCDSKKMYKSKRRPYHYFIIPPIVFAVLFMVMIGVSNNITENTIDCDQLKFGIDRLKEEITEGEFTRYHAGYLDTLSDYTIKVIQELSRANVKYDFNCR